MAGAHKCYTMTESRRTAKYGWKPSTSQEREYYNTNDELSASNSNFIKVFQEIEPKSEGICKHRVNVVMSITLKDSSNKLVSLN